jgi:hypothetical protein
MKLRALRLVCHFASALLIISGRSAYGQAKIQSCPDKFKISLDYDYVFPSYGAASGVNLEYRIQKVTTASAAWVEVWDGGLQLFHQQVPIKSKGTLVWMHLREVPNTPSSLTFAIYDPELPLFGDDPTGPRKGGVDFRSTYWAGNSPDEKPPFTLAGGASYRMVEGGQSGELQVDGLFVGTPTDLLLEQQDENEHWIAREYLSPQVFDRNHIEVTIPELFLDKPGVLGLSNKVDGPEPDLGNEVKPPQQTIYVSSKDSPTLSDVTPSEISAAEVSEGPFHITVHLHGSGFTPASTVVQSLYDHALGPGRTRFISPNDLEFDLYKYEIVIDDKWSSASPIRLWVVNSDWLHVSEGQEIRIEPSPMFPPDRFIAMRPQITSLSPDPIPMMDPAGPDSLVVTVRGEHFQGRQSVVASVETDKESQEIRLKTQFISPQELRAWLPRKLWSQHRLKYRFAVKTEVGTCGVEQVEEDDN